MPCDLFKPDKWGIPKKKCRGKICIKNILKSHLWNSKIENDTKIGKIHEMWGIEQYLNPLFADFVYIACDY